MNYVCKSFLGTFFFSLFLAGIIIFFFLREKPEGKQDNPLVKTSVTKVASRVIHDEVYANKNPSVNPVGTNCVLEVTNRVVRSDVHTNEEGPVMVTVSLSGLKNTIEGK